MPPVSWNISKSTVKVTRNCRVRPRPLGGDGTSGLQNLITQTGSLSQYINNRVGLLLQGTNYVLQRNRFSLVLKQKGRDSSWGSIPTCLLLSCLSSNISVSKNKGKVDHVQLTAICQSYRAVSRIHVLIVINIIPSLKLRQCIYNLGNRVRCIKAIIYYYYYYYCKKLHFSRGL